MRTPASVFNRGALTLMALALSTGLVVAAPSQVMAATSTAQAHVVPLLSGEQYTGTDPQATGCAATAERAPGTSLVGLYYNGVEIAAVELRFSTHCRTTWARVFLLSGAGSPAWVSAGIYRSDGRAYDGLGGACGFCVSYLYPGSGVGDYGYQVYDAGYTSYATGHVCWADSTCQEATWFGQTGGRTGSY
jgi:hypothetical protein